MLIFILQENGEIPARPHKPFKKAFSITGKAPETANYFSISLSSLICPNLEHGISTRGILHLQRSGGPIVAKLDSQIQMREMPRGG